MNTDKTKAFQATGRPYGMFVVVDTPCPTLKACRAQADQTFGPGNYTIAQIRVRKA